MHKFKMQRPKITRSPTFWEDTFFAFQTSYNFILNWLKISPSTPEVLFKVFNAWTFNAPLVVGFLLKYDIFPFLLFLLNND